jgi:hypothetical protein
MKNEWFLKQTVKQIHYLTSNLPYDTEDLPASGEFSRKFRKRTLRRMAEDLELASKLAWQAEEFVSLPSDEAREKWLYGKFPGNENGGQ